MATGRTRLKFFLQLVVVSGLVYQLTRFKCSHIFCFVERTINFNFFTQAIQ